MNTSEEAHDLGLIPPKEIPGGMEAPETFLTLSQLSGPGVTLWSAPQAGSDTVAEHQLRLDPNRPVIIGRAEGYPVPYLDPAYRPTAVVPGTGESVLLSGGGRKDTVVSRGHFMLRAAGRGILLVNGVPGVGGGIRPPTNWTLLVSPLCRKLGPGEEYLIEGGDAVILELPNGARLQIAAA